MDNLSSTLANNYTSGPNLPGTAGVPAGGFAYGAVLALTGINFNDDPSLGDLLIEVIVSGQDNVPNFTTNGYNENDSTGLSSAGHTVSPMALVARTILGW